MNVLTIPNRLYGRDQELVSLLAAFERISSGRGEVLLIPGASGVGKTALVQELQAPIRVRNGFFIRGKFEQYQQNVPYFAFRQALTALCADVQSGDALQRARIKAAVVESVGSLGQVLVDLVPEFEALLGPQPPLEEISPREARHRFSGVCRSLLKVVCLPEHPLVLFLDDWQWADAASCDLLRQLQIGTALRHLLVIVSYRDGEVHAGHPLMNAVDDLRSQAVPVTMMHVQNITASDVLEIVTDTLRPAAADVAGLAALIHGKTLGNPFFVRSFLGFLHEFGLIWFDEARNCWLWRSVRADGVKWPGDVVELFVLQLGRLDPPVQRLFSLASCLGNRFDLDSLGIISGRDPRECLAMLFAGKAGSLLGPLDGDGNYELDAAADVPRTCSFLHDRVQQAAHSLIEPAERPRTLLEIGRQLLASLPPAQLAERLFEVVGDLNAGRQLMRDAAEQTTLVSLNIAAARKAYAATAFGSALQFYRAAHDVLATPGLAEPLWRDSHRLMMQLLTERAECEFLEGSHAEGEDCIRQAVARAATAIEKATALNVLIVQYTLLARYPEAIAAGRQALAELGISLPEDGYEEARDREIAQLRRDLGKRRVSSLAELPVMSHPEMTVAARILITMGPPCYRSHQRLWGVIVPKVVNLTLRHGNIPQVGYSHTAFGGLLGWVEADYVMAREFGELATQLMTNTFRTPSDQSVFFLMIGSSIRHWFKHLKYGSQDYADAYDIGLRSGNLQYAAYAFGHNMYCRFYQGAPLAGLIQETQRSLEFSRVHVNQWALDLLEGGQHIFADLSGERAEPNGNGVWSEAEYLLRVEAHHNIQVRCIYQVLKTFALLVSGDHAEALALSDETEPLIYTVGTQGLLPWPEHVFARVLILTALHATAHEARRSTWRAELDQMLGRLRVWADNCPDNFEHKYLLASAELAKIDGRFPEAMQLYDQAVGAAHAGGFLQWAGMANERASGFWMERGNERLAHAYWQQAYVCYDRWGAAAKVRAMEAEYGRHIVGRLQAQDERGAPAGPLSDEGASAVVSRQIALLRSYANEMQQSTLRVEATTRAEDLAQAMQRVRVEIAERKRTEDALRESERMLRESQVIASLGGYDLDIPAGQWTSSEVLDAVFGIDATFVRSVEGWLALIHPDDRAMMADHLQTEVLGQGRMFDKAYRIVRYDDKVERWVHGLGRLECDAAGRAVRLRGTIQDVTARKRAEGEMALLQERMQQAHKLESVGRLAGGVAHDYNNMLAVIIGHAELGLRRADATSPLHEDLAAIHKAATRSAEITQQLLTFARKQVIRPQRLDLNATVANALKMLQPLIGERVQFTWLPGADLWPVTMDASQVDQLLTNLCLNARDAISGVGTLRISTANRVVDAALRERPADASPGDYVQLTVADSGGGMSSDQLERVFEPFYTTKGVGEGTGLGLASVYGAVRQNGGFIAVASVPGKGTTFEIYLPRSTGEIAEPPVPDQAAPAPRGSETILVVEDEPAVRRMTVRALEGQGYTVLAADGPPEAIRLAREHGVGIALLLTDVMMPEMSGYDLVAALDSTNPRLKHLFMSGYPMSAAEGDGQPEDAARFIAKPFSLVALTAKVREVLDGA